MPKRRQRLQRTESTADSARVAEALLLASRSVAMSLATRVALRCVNKALWRGVSFAGLDIALHEFPLLDLEGDRECLGVRGRR